MFVGRLAVLILLTAGAAAAAPLQSSRSAACTQWRECQQLALSAAERDDYEAFHDLAWRAVQTGPPRDPALMVLLARAQSLSGRPHDAMVMLSRLADMGVAVDTTGDDFARTRQLPGWPDVQARLERGGRADVGTSTAARTEPAKPLSPASPAPIVPASPPAAGRPSSAVSTTGATIEPAAPPKPSPEPAKPSVAAASTTAAAVSTRPEAAEALRFSTNRLTLGGLAYDSVSHRFLVGDRLGRKVMVVSEDSRNVIDLVRSDSARFHDIAAVEIDAKRGDLWVASNELGDKTAALHRLQLVSGRPL